MVTEASHPSGTGGKDHKVGLSLIDDSMAEHATAAVSVDLNVFIKPAHVDVGLPFGRVSPNLWVARAGDILVLRRVDMQSKYSGGGAFRNLVAHSDRTHAAFFIVSGATGRVLCRWPASASLRPREANRVRCLRQWSQPRLRRAPFHQMEY